MLIYQELYGTRYALRTLDVDFAVHIAHTQSQLRADLKQLIAGLGFTNYLALGGELVALHLMESSQLNDLITEFPVKGTDTVEKVQYNDKDGRVWINPTQYFGGVPAAVWNFHIGGYQVCEKWLKDRKGRKLTYEDTRHYQRIVVTLNETMRLMTEIDDVIRQYGDWLTAFAVNDT